MQDNNWIETNERFVGFFDIMGFKDLVERSTHQNVLEKLRILKNHFQMLEYINNDKALIERFGINETKIVTFSDSIIIFTKGSESGDIVKLIGDSLYLLGLSLENGIAIKGAIAFGTITVDFENNLFFGRPIIDAHLLHEQLNLYATILDHSAEVKINSLNLTQTILETFGLYKVNLKSGRVNHQLLRPGTLKSIEAMILDLNKIYNNVSGSPRIYIDNTLEYYNLVKLNLQNKSS